MYAVMLILVRCLSHRYLLIFVLWTFTKNLLLNVFIIYLKECGLHIVGSLSDNSYIHFFLKYGFETCSMACEEKDLVRSLRFMFWSFMPILFNINASTCCYIIYPVLKSPHNKGMKWYHFFKISPKSFFTGFSCLLYISAYD